ncbi:MAG: hypothetical protein WCF57_20830 [Pyrinomonadaceae bacterium]
MHERSLLLCGQGLRQHMLLLYTDLLRGACMLLIYTNLLRESLLSFSTHLLWWKML